MQQIQKRSNPSGIAPFLIKCMSCVLVMEKFGQIILSPLPNRISSIMPYLLANQTELQCGLQPEVQLQEH